ncbi:MAG: LamG-like jellyroll fold domain-containing protein [Phycisphaerales bacterium]
MKTPIVCVAALASQVLASPVAYQDLVQDKSPLLWYRFDEAVGATEAINYGTLGTDFNGVFFGPVFLGDASIQGDTAACFEHPSQPYVESASDVPASLTGNPTFTAEAVVRVFATPQNPFYAPFLHWGAPRTGQSVYFSILRNDESRPYVGFYNGGATSLDNYTLGQWVHIVWTRDAGDGTNDDITGSRLFISGEEVDIDRDFSLPGAGVPDVQASPFYVQRATAFVRYFSGNVDEVVLYDRLLADDEIVEHYDALVDNAPCPADLDGDGSLTVFDFLAFQNAFDAGERRADISPTTCTPSQDIFDFLAFQNAFDAGCP